MWAENRGAATVVALAVAVHVALTLAHGLAHATVPVPVTEWQGVYSAVVLFAAPLAGALFVRRGRVRAGAWLVLVAAVGALAFEGLFHFLVANPDHVAAVGSGEFPFGSTTALAFGSTAVLTTVGDAVLVLVAGWALRRQAHGSSSSSVSESIA